MLEHLFVYGTLRRPEGPPGGVADALRSGAAVVGEGEIAARLYRTASYPAAVPDEESRVRGTVYRLEAPDRVLRVLDRYEGCEPEGSGLFRREEVEVSLDGDGSLTAWAYLWNRSTADLREIPSGDYLRERTSARVTES